MTTKGLTAQLYLAILQRLTAAVTSLKWIDQDFGQLETYNPDDPNSRPPVIFPCALIDIGEAQADDLGQAVQMVTLMVDVRLGFTPYSPTASGTPSYVIEQALDMYNIEQEVYEALHTWAPQLTLADDTVLDIGQPLSRRTFGTERREDNLKVRVIRFTTSLNDDTASHPGTIVEIPLQLLPTIDQ